MINIKNLETGEITPFYQYKQDKLKNIKKDCLSVTSIIAKKVMTKAELEKLILSEAINVVNFNNKRYINKVELAHFLNRK
ncbi:MAG: hypothetical protein COX77_00630 [Candidatus Komeilibacteria bacterium CG_4_10_14_0_2_um_filter_37_10]|uniref:DNA-binding protein n=1 Tax=Candidatus Komeilibacteria bacterium CG_4_10_14_0_2_um_filter_37_10 TaxID=1974470 RepID=A0A2M7VG85_9BACT|nr:MAG: hypothetical protein COX77_00630 [Candidatus Komeilibacteria bacterium CG_4_10_14_0_2_um_filter_37_10]